MRSFLQFRAAHKCSRHTDMTTMSEDDFREMADYFAATSDKILDADGFIYDDGSMDIKVHMRSGVIMVTPAQYDLLSYAMRHTKWLYEGIWQQMDLRVACTIMRTFDLM